MPESDTHDTTPGTATALAEPPQPPTNPPTGVGAGAADRPRNPRSGAIVAIVLAVLALVLLGVVVALVLSSRGGSAVSSAVTRTEFESAMQKAGVKATPPSQPILLTSVVPSGSHPFSATFSAGEVAALLNEFVYEYDSAGIRIQLRDSTMSIPVAGSVTISAKVTANGGTYSGQVTLPVTFQSGNLSSTGATALTVEGMPGNAGQKAQVGGLLVQYFNSYLSAAPGLKIDSASVGADGFTVSGTAPDSLTYQ